MRFWIHIYKFISLFLPHTSTIPFHAFCLFYFNCKTLLSIVSLLWNLQHFCRPSITLVLSVTLVLEVGELTTWNFDALQHREACITYKYVFKILSVLFLHGFINLNQSSLRYGALYFCFYFSSLSKLTLCFEVALILSMILASCTTKFVHTIKKV